MTRRALTFAVGLAILIAALAAPAALGEYQGSSLFENVAPDSALDGRSLAERYPLNRYKLDHHVTITFDPVPLVGDGVDLSGIPALIMHAIADGIWDITKNLIAGVITIFTWAFSLDLLQGRGGALAPIARAANGLYDALGREWLAVAIALVGGWATWRALVQRQYANTLGQLALSVVCVLVAMVIVSQPQWTIGGASRLGNELSLALLSIPIHGDLDSGRDAKRDVSDHLFRTLVHDPWIVLEFGGLEHCVDEHNQPVKPRSRECRTRIDHRRKYAERWLRAGPPGSDARDLEYEALRQGKPPKADKLEQRVEIARRFAGYHLSDADKPAVDIQQEAMAGERLGYAALIFVGSLGAVILLGALSVGVVLAQVLALLLFAFGPFVPLAAVFPGAGHATFRVWAERMLFAVTRKIWYGLILSVVLAVSTALLGASSQMGWLMAFGLQCAFYWAVLLYRREIYGAMLRALPGTRTTAEVGDDAGGRARGTVLAGIAGFRQIKPKAPPTPPPPPPRDDGGAGIRRDGSRSAAVGRRILGIGSGLAGQYAAQGHTERIVSAAAEAARAQRARELPTLARGELKREHVRAEQRLQDERQRRQRISALQARTPSDPRAATAQRQELARLRRQGDISTEEYRALEARVADVSKRRQDGAPAFTKAEVSAKTKEIQARDGQSESAASNGRVRPLDGVPDKREAVAEEDVQAQVERDAERLRELRQAEQAAENGDDAATDGTGTRAWWRRRRGNGDRP